MRIAVQTLASRIVVAAFFAALMLWPAGTLNYWQAWVFIAVFAVATVVPSLYLAIKRPAALERRLKAGPTAETRPLQKLAITAAIVAVLALLLLSALDHRFGWSNVPVAVVLLGNILVAVGLGLAQLVVFQNSYAGASITVEAGQKVVSTGLYGIVRHPMYSGSLIMMTGVPLALASYWGLLAVVLSVPILVARIDDEERMLRGELDGYDEYTQKVHYRLVPGVW